MATQEELQAQADQEIEDAKPLYKQVNNERMEFSESDYDQAKTDLGNAKWDEQQNGYKRSRQENYPSYGDQMDYIFHNGLDAWKEDMIQPIKDEFPKPE